MKKLEKASGADFDKEFATYALKDHAMDLSLYQKEAQQGQDTDLKQFAQTMVPKLQHHLEMSKDAARAVGVSDSDISSILTTSPEATGGASTPGGSNQGSTGSSSDQSGQPQPQAPSSQPEPQSPSGPK